MNRLYLMCQVISTYKNNLFVFYVQNICESTNQFGSLSRRIQPPEHLWILTDLYIVLSFFEFWVFEFFQAIVLILQPSTSPFRSTGTAPISNVSWSMQQQSSETESESRR